MGDDKFYELLQLRDAVDNIKAMKASSHYRTVASIIGILEFEIERTIISTARRGANRTIPSNTEDRCVRQGVCKNSHDKQTVTKLDEMPDMALTNETP